MDPNLSLLEWHSDLSNSGLLLFFFVWQKSSFCVIFVCDKKSNMLWYRRHAYYWGSRVRCHIRWASHVITLHPLYSSVLLVSWQFVAGFLGYKCVYLCHPMFVWLKWNHSQMYTKVNTHFANLICEPLRMSTFQEMRFKRCVKHTNWNISYKLIMLPLSHWKCKKWNCELWYLHLNKITVWKLNKNKDVITLDLLCLAVSSITHWQWHHLC
jgi:hypothetical protein